MHESDKADVADEFFVGLTYAGQTYFSCGTKLSKYILPYNYFLSSNFSSIFKLLLITTKSSTRSESKLWRLVVTKFPEKEKTLSLFAELAGIARTAFATPDWNGEGKKREKEVRSWLGSSRLIKGYVDSD